MALRNEESFPRDVAPHQPIHRHPAIAHEVAPGITAEVRFSGDVFEMEDQRNWTDASTRPTRRRSGCRFRSGSARARRSSGRNHLAPRPPSGGRPGCGRPHYIFNRWREEGSAAGHRLGRGEPPRGAEQPGNRKAESVEPVAPARRCSTWRCQTRVSPGGGAGEGSRRSARTGGRRAGCFGRRVVRIRRRARRDKTPRRALADPRRWR